MIKISRQIIDEIDAASDPRDLHHLVQSAIELEHATIPTYLTALFSLKPGSNTEVAAILRSVVMEEMLHMAIASNLLLALGGTPAIDRPGMIPKFPGKLPMSVDGGMTVHLRKCSIRQVRDVFMKIEQPLEPIKPTKLLAEAATTYATIGEFYGAIGTALRKLGPAAFARGKFGAQVVDPAWFPAGQLFHIFDLKSALAGIEMIVEQGEGNSNSVLDPQWVPAHYYRFQQIVEGRLIKYDPDHPGKLSFTGDPVPFDPDQVHAMVDDPVSPEHLPAGSQARRLATRFACGYTELLHGLHTAFSGTPSAIGRTMGLMYQLRTFAQQVLSEPLPDHPGLMTGLSFTYQPSMAPA